MELDMNKLDSEQKNILLEYFIRDAKFRAAVAAMPDKGWVASFEAYNIYLHEDHDMAVGLHQAKIWDKKPDHSYTNQKGDESVWLPMLVAKKRALSAPNSGLQMVNMMLDHRPHLAAE